MAYGLKNLINKKTNKKTKEENDMFAIAAFMEALPVIAIGVLVVGLCLQ